MSPQENIYIYIVSLSPFSSLFSTFYYFTIYQSLFSQNFCVKYICTTVKRERERKGRASAKVSKRKTEREVRRFERCD